MRLGADAAWLLQFEAREAGELVADLDHAVLVGSKKKPTSPL
jgi:hypothetical protein